MTGHAEQTEPDRAMHEWFARGLAAAPEGVALRIGDRSWSYAQVQEMALSWAGPCGPPRPRAREQWES